MFPNQSELQQTQKVFNALAAEAIRDHQDNKANARSNHTTITDISKIMFELMVESSVPESEKSLERLMEEAQLFVIAGTLTTAHTLMTITFHLLAKPDSLKRLKAELTEKEASDPREESESESHLPLKTLNRCPISMRLSEKD